MKRKMKTETVSEVAFPECTCGTPTPNKIFASIEHIKQNARIQEIMESASTLAHAGEDIDAGAARQYSASGGSDVDSESCFLVDQCLEPFSPSCNIERSEDSGQDPATCSLLHDDDDDDFFSPKMSN